ncbi:MAG: hypothetical protein AB7S38_10380 [Vulcanimicrobiota bacterium]
MNLTPLTALASATLANPTAICGSRRREIRADDYDLFQSLKRYVDAHGDRRG